jgi:hypothetical protein
VIKCICLIFLFRGLYHLKKAKPVKNVKEEKEEEKA